MALAQPGATFVSHFWGCVQAWGQRVAMRDKKLGIWRSHTWDEYGAMARTVGMGLVALGVKPGEAVSIMSENCPEWMFCEMGALSVRAISAGVYTTDSPGQVQFLLSDCGSRVHIVENDQQLDKILEVRASLPQLKKIVVLDTKGLERFSDPQVMTFSDLVQLGRRHDAENPGLFERLRDAVRPEDTAVLVYTSGTTGQPKGAMLSQASVVYQIHNWDGYWDMKPGEEQFCFLPLCHVAEKTVSMWMPMRWGTVVNFAESFDTVAENMREVSPHGFVGVPRVWEKFYSGIDIAMRDATWIGKWMYRAALAVGYRVADIKLANRAVPLLWRLAYALAHRLVLYPLKTVMGLERVHLAATGAAPISPNLIRWYVAIGVPMREMYGMTEGTGPVSIPQVGDYRLGAVGKGGRGFELRLSQEGEIQIKGPIVFKGYYNMPERTAEAFTPDGWYRTGDVGELHDGHLKITDRLKDIIITAGGKNITPSLIENELKFSPYITDAIVIGDRRKFLSCLVMLDQETVAKHAQDHDIPFTDYASLCRRPEIVQLIDAEVAKVNAKFARVEQIKKFHLIDIQLTAEDEELTPTMKLKRRLVNKKYADTIEAMYSEA